MSIDLSEHGTGYQDLKEHIGHKIVVAGYGNLVDPVNIAIECKDCGEVLLSFDKPENEDEEEQQRRDEKNGLYPDKEDIAN